MAAGNGSTAVISGDAKGKKKSGKFIPLPGVQSVESSLPWHTEFTHRAGRHAVATTDLAAGTLILVEQPFFRAPLTKFAAAVCTRCLRPLHATGEVPPPGNPCLPRYCPRCKATPTPLDAQLAALRIKLPELAEAHQLDPLMLNILMMLDLQRSGADIAAPVAADLQQAPRSRQPFDDLCCTVADYDALTNVWDRKAEAWRKKVGGAVRALHKELTALSDAGTVPGYSVSPITRMQADAAQLAANIQQIHGPNSSTDTAVGIFPALSVFHHSCMPNAHFLVLGSRVYVRTLMAVEAGKQLTVTYVNPVTEPRHARQSTLMNERHYVCGCSRCSAPLPTSLDRLLEGVVCLNCLQDVMLPLEDGPENDAAREMWREHVAEVRKEEEAQAARATRKKAGKKAATSSGTTTSTTTPPTTTGVEVEEEGKDDEEAAAAAEVVEEEEAAVVAAKEEAEEEAAEGSGGGDPLRGVMFWQCCACSMVQPARTVDQSGPGDVTSQAAAALQRGMTFINLKHAELSAQGEAMLEEVANGMNGRLPVYHHFVSTAHVPLININLKKGDGLKAMNFAVHLWSVDKDLSDGQPTMQQLQCLEAVVDAAEAKASAVHSQVIKKQLEKKVKQAKEELNKVRPLLVG